MSDSDVIIRAENVSKTYRLYAKPHYRFLDMLGWLHKPNAYTEHSALSNVNLTIKRGEKVAFIGRNGAGKSTLLKMITGVIQPSSGNLVVSQGAHALLQIGSGFHQDFTGRQNALAYMAHLGVTNQDANRKLVDIVEFAELEEYIDQPIKTYSTGMVARLMFATSTVIEPELLVLDEILGVGDAYFSNKSFERIREMCESKGTTVLLVSHDIYSASKLCERMVWIDRGQVLFDGTTRDAMLAYETSVRTQEENRLRSKKIQALEFEAKESVDEKTVKTNLLVEFSSLQPLDQPVQFRRISVRIAARWQTDIPVAELNGFDVSSGTYLVSEESNWGDIEKPLNEPPYREIKNYGTPFQKAIFVIQVPSEHNYDLSQLEVVCDYRSSNGTLIKVRVFNTNNILLLSGDLETTNSEWVTGKAVSLSDYSSSHEIKIPTSIGTNRIQIKDARFVNEDDVEIFTVFHGQSAHLKIDYQIHDSKLSENPDIVVAMHRDGSFDVCRYRCKSIYMNASIANIGTIDFRISKMPLTKGKYTLTVLMAEEGYYDKDQNQYFTINPGVYACRSRMFEFDVSGGTGLSFGTVFVGEADWALSAKISQIINGD